MAWSWSHSQEAYSNAYEQVVAKDREWLEVVYAEWEGHDGDDDLNDSKYKRALKKAKTLPEDVLAEHIWERMSEQATCTNGGWEAWCCPFGCGCHTVPFEPVTTV